MGFAELFELQAVFALMRASIAAEPAEPIPYRQEVIDAFKRGLGFELTTAQRRSMWEMFKDIERPTPMNRLLNGDVGSGKTAVAAAGAAMAHAAGLQSVVMAPTEILARQHLHKFREYLEQSFPGLTVELLVSSQSAAERRRVRAAAASGHCSLVVGTHALIEEDVEFADLGLAVVDEQHRFGTRQRELLRAIETKKEKLKEIILSMNANADGENTADYLKQLLAPLSNAGVKITILGRGLSTGTELEYSDSDTIVNALKNRA